MWVVARKNYRKSSKQNAAKVPTCFEIEPWKYFDNVEEYDFPTGIDDTIADFDDNAPYDVYNLNGVKVGNNVEGLTSGLYIIRQGSAVKKITIRE